MPLITVRCGGGHNHRDDLSSAVPCGLVLDDYHAITSEEIHAAVSLILDHLPPTAHLVLTSRSEDDAKSGVEAAR